MPYQKDNFHYWTVKKSPSKVGKKKPPKVKKQRRKVDYKFFTHYHPYTEELIEKLNRDGLPAMLNVHFLKELKENLTDSYTVHSFAAQEFPVEEIDVSDHGPYAVYNWELFYHAPLTIAVHLSKNQRFAEAQKWFHYIFDPTSNDPEDSPKRFWKFLRFREETTPEFINEMLLELAKGEDPALKEKMVQSIQAWRDKPFQPHVIARSRYLAYQLHVVMKYLDNLIAWGDSLFRQDTIETLNEATQVYVLAANILGPKPQKIPPRGRRSPKTYHDLKEKGIDAFGNALIELENDFPFNTSPITTNAGDEAGTQAVFGIARSLYFCIPPNGKLLEYWDTVADRLFKMRHCMNIEGVVRQLPLFEPPIDPGMLVKAVAAGMDIGSIINNINQPISTIRSPLLLQKAQEICAEVKALGGALLSALEKGDAEQLSLLRHKHEMNLLNLVKDVKFIQWKESVAATEALLSTRATAFQRFRHYKLILGNKEGDINKLKAIEVARRELTEETFDQVYRELVQDYATELAIEPYRKETSVGGLMEFAGNIVTSALGGELGKTLPLNKNENAELNIFLPSSDNFNALSMGLQIAAPVLGLIPQFNVHGTPLGVGGAAEFGGMELKAAAEAASKIAKDIANAFASSADRASRMASYYRRAEDYVLQANLATSELMQYGRQVISSLIREQITKKEYDNHVKQIEQAIEIDAFLKDKFTNEALYRWMQGEISRIYFETYKFAYDIAKRTEQTMKYELMRKEFDELNLIKFGYWDGGRKGLLAGEALALDLKRLEMAYHEHNRREYEMTKHISLHRLDPMALLKLKATGSCEISIPEWVYDLDSPGQYMRRIKTIALSIPCITGPYTGIHCKFSLLRSTIRVSSLLGDGYSRDPEEDNRFRDFTGTIQTIVTSSAQNDSGLFETNLRDERYLPFEGAGAISRWRLEIPNEIPQFDMETISDVILHIRYTCREAGHLKKEASTIVNEEILQQPDNLIQLFSVNYDFPGEWHLFTSATNDAQRKLEVILAKLHFPYWAGKIGINDSLTASFCRIDWNKKRLVLAPQTITLDPEGDGWKCKVDNTKAAVFNFLKNNQANKLYMAISYKLGA